MKSSSKYSAFILLSLLLSCGCAIKLPKITATGERTARLYRKIEWLNLLGNVAPMLGLLGTVWGMIVAFGELEAKGGKANPEDLAGGIMIALVSTFMGLIVAIPALAGYGIFRSRIEQMSMEAALVAEELLANFKPSAG